MTPRDLPGSLCHFGNPKQDRDDLEKIEKGAYSGDGGIRNRKDKGVHGSKENGGIQDRLAVLSPRTRRKVSLVWRQFSQAHQFHPRLGPSAMQQAFDSR